ncbi:unnamed protein product [Blepharisma stoltei]|uniref:Uncharacterized protein n=1 Tax=Blepharisma stoltei TaxID=1481888 RepID=A0AAU9K380_9CILI|nr:unnamed protein product [Blepharisma stoltei]
MDPLDKEILDHFPLSVSPKSSSQSFFGFARYSVYRNSAETADSSPCSEPKFKSSLGEFSSSIINLHRCDSPSVYSEISPEPASAWIEKIIDSCKCGNVDLLLSTIEEYQKEKALNLNSEDVGDLINSPLINNWCAIHYVCQDGKANVLKELLKLGANCNIETADGWTPLQLSCDNCYFPCVELLLNHPGIQINKLTILGSALHIACEKGYTKIVRLLLENKASISLENAQGKNPLELATKQRILELIPQYSGNELLHKYSKISSEDKPPSFSGEVYWTNPWQINDKLIFLFLDTQEGSLKHYNQRSTYIDSLPPDISIQIKDIQDIRPVSNTHNDQRYYFSIETREKPIKYYCKYSDMANVWIKQIQEAVQYFQLKGFDNGSKEENKNILNRACTHFEENADENSDIEEDGQSVGFNSFDIIEELGNGSFGQVFKVRKKNDGEIYALKVLNKSSLKRHNQLKYAIAECKILKSSKNPFIIKLHWAFQTPKNLYMALQYCGNGDLEQLIENKRYLNEKEAQFYIAEAILAIEYLHSVNIVYRDLKPQNILLDEDGHIRLADFGLAKENISKWNPAMTFCGSPAYLAPELLSKNGAWKPADIYSIGVNLYEMLVGHLPFNEQDVSKIYKQISSGKLRFPKNISSDAKHLIQSLMHKNPEKRPTISQVKQHRFFCDINWDLLSKKKINPPLDPSLFSYKSAQEICDVVFVDCDYESVDVFNEDYER